MNCKELNIEPCPWCIYPPHSYPGGLYNGSCWIAWWGEQFTRFGVKQYIIESIKTRNMESWHYIYLSAAIKQFNPELVEWFDKIMILI